MKAGLLAAWLTGELVVIWRQVHKDHKPPVPGALVAITGFFAGLAILADVFPAAAPVITVTAWGLDVAAVLNVLPEGLAAQIGTSVSTAEAAQ